MKAYKVFGTGFLASAPNPSIERTLSGKPGSASHVKRRAQVNPVPIFKVIRQHNVEQQVSAKTLTFLLLVSPIEGEIVAGLEFWGYDTHHPFTVSVRSVKAEGLQRLLECETSRSALYDGFFDGTVINSAGASRRERFHYDHNN